MRLTYAQAQAIRSPIGRQPAGAKKLADMQTEIALGQGCLRMGRMFDEGTLPIENISDERNNW